MKFEENKTIKTHELRSQLADVINRVAYGKEDIILERRNQSLVVLISLEKYNNLQLEENK